MLHHTDRSLPKARVLRTVSGTAPNPPLSARLEDWFEPYRPRVREALGVAIGLWPVWAVSLLALALLWSAGYQQP